jgi:hypothetical protein
LDQVKKEVGRATPRASLAVGKIIVWHIGRGPIPMRGRGAIYSFN